MWILSASLALAGPTVLTAGASHSCFSRHDGTVWCWGGLDRADLDAGGLPVRKPTQLAGLKDIVQVDAGGERRTCAVRRDRSVWCWQAGETPQSIPGLQADEVSVGEAHRCALDRGAVWCWGYNAKGQVGTGKTAPTSAPAQVPGITDAIQVAAGWYHSCALRKTGEVACWGMGTSGQLGSGVLQDSPTPVAVRYLTDAVEIDAGSSHTCAIRQTGQVVCWGAGRAGQLGTGGREGSAAIVAVPGVDDAVDVAAGLDHACAVRASGAVSCWGNNAAGQVGSEMPKGHALVPQPVLGLTDASKVTAGAQHSCVLGRTGSVACFGQNLAGQLGDGTTEKRMTPVLLIP